MNSRSLFRRGPFLSLLLATGLVSACGVGCSKNAGPPRYTVSGTVRFRGEPVPLGTIAFEPDASRGNKGPAGYADIVNGRFSTHLGAVGGPHIVRINGASGPVVDESQPTTLFSNFTTTCDLPRETTTLDFDVPPQSSSRPR